MSVHVRTVTPMRSPMTGLFSMPIASISVYRSAFALLCSSLILAACGGEPTVRPRRRAARRRAADGRWRVEVVTLAPKPVEQTTEFVATVKSRRSTTIQPQVEGFITRIAVRSGERVARGARADRDRFGAGSRPRVASLESMRAAREADVAIRAAAGRSGRRRCSTPARSASRSTSRPRRAVQTRRRS